MANALKLEIVTPERLVFDEEVEFFVIRSSDGDLGVLPRHAPIFTTVVPCVLKFRQQGKEDYIAVMGGFLEVSENRATVLTDAAEKAAEIDVLRARQAKERAEAALAEKREIVHYGEVEVSLRKALLRLHAADLIKHRRRGTANLTGR